MQQGKKENVKIRNKVFAFDLAMKIDSQHITIDKIVTALCIGLIACGAGYYESTLGEEEFLWHHPKTVVIFTVLLGRLFLLAFSGNLFDDREWKGYLGFGMSSALTIGITVYGFSLEKIPWNDVLLYQVVNWTLFFCEVALGISRIKSIDHKSVIASLRDEIEMYRLTIDQNRETIEANSSKIEEQANTIEKNSLAIGKHSAEIENYKKRIGSFESEIDAKALQIENQSKQIAQLKNQIEKHRLDSELVAELRKGIAGPTGIHWLCDCNEPRFIGNKAKDKRLICNKCKEK